LIHERCEFTCNLLVVGGRADTLKAQRRSEIFTARNHAAANFELGSTELTCCSSLLLEHLLFVGIRVADLHYVLFAPRLANGSIVQLFDDLLADVTVLETESY
jgi:hypothetical protein